MNRNLAFLLTCAAIFASCGDVNKVSVSLAFPDDTTSTATKQRIVRIYRSARGARDTGPRDGA